MERTWRLRLGIQHLLRVRQCSGQQLERILGHITWACLLRPETQAIISSCYVFIRPSYSKVAFMWGSVLRELRQVSALLPLMHADIGAEWDERVIVSDASDYGYGVLERDLPVSKVSEWGRTAEHWRYMLEDSTKARAIALADPTTVGPSTLSYSAGGVSERTHPGSVRSTPLTCTTTIGLSCIMAKTRKYTPHGRSSFVVGCSSQVS